MRAHFDFADVIFSLTFYFELADFSCLVIWEYHFRTFLFLWYFCFFYLVLHFSLFSNTGHALTTELYIILYIFSELFYPV